MDEVIPGPIFDASHGGQDEHADAQREPAPAPSAGTVETKLEVVVIPVADVERAKRFYGAWGGAWMGTSPTAPTGGRCR